MNVVAPSGVVTFLFTDIEGSTRRWEADADGMRAALAAHDELMRQTVDGAQRLVVQTHRRRRVCGVLVTARGRRRRGGRAAGARTAGADGHRDRRGRAARRRLLRCGAEPRGAGDGGRARRADSARRRDGWAHHRESHVGDLGHAAARYRQAGQRISGVRATDCATDFPPLRTLDSTPGNLRTPTTSFLGREAEITELQRELKAHRMVTLTGPGGVGKTRLALEVGVAVGTRVPRRGMGG